jgi:uncharacterized protein (DUF2267 family)
MSFTGVDGLDRSIDKTNVRLADVARGFGTDDRRLTYRATRAWAAHPEGPSQHGGGRALRRATARAVTRSFYDGWNPGRVPIKYSCSEYVTRFAREARVRESDVAKAADIVTAIIRLHVSCGAVDQALGQLPADVRALLEPKPAQPVTGGV